MKYNGGMLNELVREIFARGCTIESEVFGERIKSVIVRLIDRPRKLYKIHYAGRGRVVRLFTKVDDGNWLDWMEV